jgi:hypothetical protein
VRQIESPTEATRRQLDFFLYWRRYNFAKDKKRDAMRMAGYSDFTKAKEVVEPMMKQIRKEMKRQGITVPYLVSKHKELLECTDAMNEDHPDNKIQLKALQEAYKINEVYPMQKIQVDKTERSVHVDIETIRIAEELSGEKIIDVEPLEEEILALTGGPADDPL